MNKRKRRLPPVAAALLAPAAFAITEAEWRADNSLIPDPAAGPFYVVEPDSPAHADELDVTTVGLDSTPTERIYDLDFETGLTTQPNATILCIR